MEIWFLQVVATKVPERDDLEAALARLCKELDGCWKMMIPKNKWAPFAG